jgi:hypothetical protein
MPTVYKYSLVFNFQPDVLQGAVTPPHLGGFSENYWYANPLTQAQVTALATARAQMLSYDVSIVGWRTTPYVYTVNRLQPQPSTAGALPLQGDFDEKGTNSPEDCLRIAAVAGVLAKWTMFLHAIPDDLIESNQYIPNRAFNLALAAWLNLSKGGAAPQLPAMSWVGRDKTQPLVRVLSVNPIAGTIVTSGNTGAVAGTNFIRLHRVYADTGVPIQGTFFVVGPVTIGAGGVYTYPVQGLPALTCSVPRGTARNDLLATAPLTLATASILSERKVGRPSLLFRGRRSKQRS